MDRVIELLATLRAAATEECKRGCSEACSLAEDIEQALNALGSIAKVNPNSQES